MNKKLIAIALLTSCSSIAYAGFFDSLFGTKEVEEKVVVEAPVKTSAPIAKEDTSSALEAASNMAIGLLPSITKQLGVTDAQAEGGMGALMQVAQSTLSSGEFSELSQGIPGMDTLLAAAPSLSGGAGKSAGIGGLLSSVGGAASSLGSLAGLTQQFEALGLSPDMIVQFATMAMDYFSGDSEESEGESEGINIGELLQKGLGSILG
jgi:hypothetical protein